VPPVPPKSKTADDDPVAIITVDGVKYRLAFLDLTGSHAEMCRQFTGKTPTQLMKGGDDFDLPEIAAFVYLARLQAGHDVAFADILDSISYRSSVDIVPEVGGDDHPEASAAN